MAREKEYDIFFQTLRVGFLHCFGISKPSERGVHISEYVQLLKDEDVNPEELVNFLVEYIINELSRIKELSIDSFVSIINKGTFFFIDKRKLDDLEKQMKPIKSRPPAGPLILIIIADKIADPKFSVAEDNYEKYRRMFGFKTGRDDDRDSLINYLVFLEKTSNKFNGKWKKIYGKSLEIIKGEYNKL